ncbi:histidine kinase [Altererythrobacter sp. B11]|uniref:sensor histidine kinase n=1 Tax=Altererythrobacter sp. B11 TaxID=2060312 RepID=UPI000DC6E9FB|nr:HAMP domain-containing sensor histidine kinase [Altererythrobacter sp. B11]BBC73027.1 histidine kinase [Altererythrobacter sp. B11]
MSGTTIHIARARTDTGDRLIEAEEPLASLQRRLGGELPGVVAAPALLELIRKARLYGLRFARPIRAQDGAERITAWAEVVPDADGCAISMSNWHVAPLSPAELQKTAERRSSILRQSAELSARLGPEQELLAVESRCVDLADLSSRMELGRGRRWTEFVGLAGAEGGQKQNLHWRLLDGARLTIDGSSRSWTAHLIPLGAAAPGRDGFELHLVADEPPLAEHVPPMVGATRQAMTAALGRELAPVLRQPVARIIANAETIRTQLAGPLAEEYSNYAADIATAGEHLLALIDDLVDLEVVEDEDFSTAPDHIDLADVARRAAGILGMRARERGIGIDAPKPDESAPAVAEFRRVLQILLNLVGNAIRYTPEGSQVWLRVESEGAIARLVVADQGEGLSEDQQTRIFEKFERLGRTGDGGSGLGLYISRRLARAMGGELRVESAPGQGARFILDLPADPEG